MAKEARDRLASFQRLAAGKSGGGSAAQTVLEAAAIPGLAGRSPPACAAKERQLSLVHLRPSALPAFRERRHGGSS
jgi:hypothetical protein